MTKNRKPRIDGDVAYIPLTQGRVAIIDASDLGLVGSYKWQAKASIHTAYARRKSTLKCGKETFVGMHRVVMDAPEHLEVDHVNGDGLDNRRANLRLATRSQNMRNQRVRKNSLTGYKGVTKYGNKWRSRIVVKGNSHHLGYFDTPEEAHAAYCEASNRLHGEFGRTTNDQQNERLESRARAVTPRCRHGAGKWNDMGFSP